MTFFNKKEEVIEIQLTQYGKYLLSKGKWRPKFYTFSDDDIIYDPEFLQLSEKRKESNERIQNTTPNLRAVYDHSSAETRVMRLNGHIIEDDTSGRAMLKSKIGEIPYDEIYGKDFINDLSMLPDNRNLIRNYIGTSELGNQSPPSWSVISLNEEIFRPNIQLSSSSPNVGLKVPQIEMNIDVNIYARKMGEENRVSDAFFNMQSGVEDRVYFKDNYEIQIEDRAIILKIEEENVKLEKENFDIEFYLVEDEREVVTSGDETRKEETLIKLFCTKNDFETVDQVDLIDTYLEIIYDDDIPPGELIRDNGTNAERQGGMYLPRTGIPRGDINLDNEEVSGETRDKTVLGAKPFGTSTTILLREEEEDTFDDDDGDGGVCD